MKICMAGACGRMGRRILEIATAEGVEIGAALDRPEFEGTEIVYGLESGAQHKIAVESDAAAAVAKADVLIDFTLASACLANVRAAVAAGKAAVIGTTGLAAAQVAELRELDRKSVV